MTATGTIIRNNDGYTGAALLYENKRHVEPRRVSTVQWQLLIPPKTIQAATGMPRSSGVKPAIKPP
jgi:hypothetical protein